MLLGVTSFPGLPCFYLLCLVHNNTQEQKTAITNLPILCIIVNVKGRSKWKRPGNKAWEQSYIESEVESTVPGAFVHKLQYAHLFVRSLKTKMLKVPLKVHSCSIHQNWYAQNF